MAKLWIERRSLLETHVDVATSLYHRNTDLFLASKEIRKDSLRTCLKLCDNLFSDGSSLYCEDVLTISQQHKPKKNLRSY